jgi:hypothetical protein
MPSSTRQRLTEATVRRFYRDGFRNVGLEQVLATGASGERETGHPQPDRVSGAGP